MAEGFSGVGRRALLALCGVLPVLFCLQGPVRAGGGGASPPGGGDGFPALLILVGFVAFVYGSVLLAYKRRFVRHELARWARRDPSWDSRALEAHVRNTFHRVQDAWCRQDLDALRELLHPDLYRDWEARVMEMRSEGVVSVVEGLKLLGVSIVGAEDYRDGERDSFVALVTMWVAKYKVDGEGRVLEGTKAADIFEEYWRYEREGGRWLLREVVDANGLLSCLLGAHAPVVSEEFDRPA